MSDYIPEHVITVHHDNKLIILTILGTRVYPNPQPMDILLDLMANTKPYLSGQAHSGLAWGSANIVKIAVPKLKTLIGQYPGYTVLVLGYSLGAGLAQLVALDCHIGQCHDMLPHNTDIMVIGYGSPPVFDSDQVPQLENVFLVQNNEVEIHCSIFSFLSC